MTVHRPASLIAATWLIGLGLVVLARQTAGLDWAEAWPLFVILLGVATLVSRAVAVGDRAADPWSWTAPILFIAAGVVLLLSTTGRLGRDPLDMIAETWPWVVIGLGVWYLVGAIAPFGRRPIEDLVVPLAGASEGSVRIRFGAGQLSIGQASPGHLVDGRFVGGVIRRDRGPGRVELEQDPSYGLPWLDHPADWSVGLAPDIPLDLRLDTGAARAMVDLSGVRARSVELHTGASETRIRVPRAAGATSVRAETGAASLIVEVPAGVAARIRSRMALGTSQVDETRFPRTATGFESAGFASAENRVDLDLQGGVGSIRVVGIA
jgi:hypothetical protein